MTYERPTLGNGLAVLGAIVVAIGTLGPWASGDDFAVMSEPEPTTSYGTDNDGEWIVVISFALAAAVLACPTRGFRAIVGLGAALFMIYVAFVAHMFSCFLCSDTRFEWGHDVVLAGAGVATLSVLVGLPWKRFWRSAAPPPEV